MRVSDYLEYLAQIAPLTTAADWDNVGLLVGQREQEVEGIMSCLTIGPEIVAEAKRKNCQLILSHHPFPFRPLGKITDASMTGSLALEIIRQGMSVICPHTAFDNSDFGINQMLAEHLEMHKILPIYIDKKNQAKVGRVGRFAQRISLEIICQKLSEITQQKQFQLSLADNSKGSNQSVEICAITCGSAGDLLPEVIKSGSQVWVIGELSYHKALEARAAGINVIVAGHHATENFAIHRLGEKLAKDLGKNAGKTPRHFPSEVEQDPFQWLKLP